MSNPETLLHKESPKTYLFRRLAALTLVGISAFGVLKVGEKIVDNFDGAECTGEQLITVQPRDSIWGLADTMVSGDARTGDVASVIIEMNPEVLTGALLIGTVLAAPETCA